MSATTVACVEPFIGRFLEQTAARHSWYGGGSAAALACALSAALLEKLACLPRPERDGKQAGQATSHQAIRAIRKRCTRLIEVDADAFAGVIRASKRHDRAATQRALRAAIRVPWQVSVCAQRLLRIAGQMKARVSPRYRVDLRCAEVLAKASGNAARALVRANLTWLNEPAARRRIRQQLARLT